MKRKLISRIFSAAMALCLTASAAVSVQPAQVSAESQHVQLYYAVQGKGSDGKVDTYGDISIQNIAYVKDVVVHYTVDGQNWNDLKASYVKPDQNNSGYEVWHFDIDQGVSKFAIKYQVNGNTYWDNNGQSNYTFTGKSDSNADVVLGKSTVVEASGDGFGGIYVKNLAYQKTVGIRYSTDNWATYHDLDTSFLYSQDANTDEFNSPCIPEGSKYAVYYTVNGQKYWDNNYGDNYTEGKSTINNNTRLQILHKYAPNVWLDKNEEFFPSTVEFAFDNMIRYKSDDGKYWIKTKQALTSPSDYSIPYFKGDLANAKVYAFWKDVDDKSAKLVYFTFYPYNRGKEFIKTMWGNHVGDWESVIVSISISDDKTSITPTKVTYKAHSLDAETYPWEYVNKVELTHPVVYSAKGSHGTWKDSGSHKYNTFPALEDECSEGYQWKTWDNVAAFYYDKQLGLNTAWPAWMSTDYSNDGSGDPSVPGNGPIYRWGNEESSGSYLGYHRLENGPTGPADKDVWTKNY